jgi:hypothetical protein
VNGARVVAYSCELLRFRVRGIVGIENGLGGPDAYVTVCRVCVSSNLGNSASRVNSAMVVDEPPAAVARRDPSGETWQLYTSKSFCSPVTKFNVSKILTAG